MCFIRFVIFTYTKVSVCVPKADEGCTAVKASMHTGATVWSPAVTHTCTLSLSTLTAALFRGGSQRGLGLMMLLPM